MLQFDNRLIRELPGDPETGCYTRQVFGAVWSRVRPTPVSAPRVLSVSPDMAAELGLPVNQLFSADWAAVLAGNALMPGMDTYSTCYGGHQFGSWAGQLGDGRAIFLGEVISASGQRLEMQLKGAGGTPYSRRGDGRAVLRSSLREFLCSEAMHHLGIPTTRALSLVATGDEVIRDMFYDGRPRAEPGAIVCRVAPSFLRFGHFELPAARGEDELLRRIVDYAVKCDDGGRTAGCGNDVSQWFSSVCERTARLMAHWMRVGFVHGVMNTDNLSILGLTIDYGPYGWVEAFDPAWTPNTTDAAGRRYCYARQPAIARWNLLRLADALMRIEPDRQAFAAGLECYDATYADEFNRQFAAKFGLATLAECDESLLDDVFALLQRAEVDMSVFFRALARVDPEAPDLAPIAGAFYSEPLYARYARDFREWLVRWADRVRQESVPAAVRVSRMNAVNPCYVLRNALAQQAIERAEAGDLAMVEELLDVLRHPYTEQSGREAFSARSPEWARHRPGCSMLSCSS